MAISRPIDAASIANIPLWAACQNGLVDIVNALLQNGADPNIPNSNGEVPLVIAVKANQDQIVAALSHHPKLQPSSLVDAFAAAYALKEPKIKNMLACINAPRAANENNTTRLHIAVQNLDVNAVSALLATNHAIDVMNNETKVPLQLAIEGNSVDIFTVLLEKNANPLCVSGTTSPLHLALKHENPHYLNLLVPALKKHDSADKRWFADELKTLSVFYQRGILKRLLEAGMDKNYKNEAGQTLFDLVYPDIRDTNNPMFLFGKGSEQGFHDKLTEIIFLYEQGLMPSNPIEIAEELTENAKKVSKQHEKLYLEVMNKLNPHGLTPKEPEPAQKEKKEHKHRHHHKDKATSSESGLFADSERKHHHSKRDKKEKSHTHKH